LIDDVTVVGPGDTGGAGVNESPIQAVEADEIARHHDICCLNGGDAVSLVSHVTQTPTDRVVVVEHADFISRRIVQECALAERDAVPVVAADDVARTRSCPPDGVVAGGIEEIHSVHQIAEGRLTSFIDADKVALHHVVRRADAIDFDTVRAVAGNDVSSAGSSSSGCIVRRTFEMQTGKAIPDGYLACGIGAYEVALDKVTRRRCTRDVNAVDSIT
jgi:hypothetical protein